MVKESRKDRILRLQVGPTSRTVVASQDVGSHLLQVTSKRCRLKHPGDKPPLFPILGTSARAAKVGGTSSNDVPCLS